LRAPGDTDVGANVLLAWFCCSVASVYLGVATAARNYAVEWAKTRKPVLFERPIGHFPGVQFHVADMEIELTASRALIHDTARQWMSGGLRAREDLARIVMAKTQTTNAAIRVVEQAMSIVGAPGIFRKSPMQRFYRDALPPDDERRGERADRQDGARNPHGVRAPSGMSVPMPVRRCHRFRR
jgi:alkylation response protein AidB-like acyl-CoA dehydrogenase